MVSIFERITHRAELKRLRQEVEDLRTCRISDRETIGFLRVANEWMAEQVLRKRHRKISPANTRSVLICAYSEAEKGE